MSRRAAKVTQTEITRAMRAAEDRGPEWAVRILPDGTIELVRKLVDERVATTPPKLRAVL